MLLISNIVPPYPTGLDSPRSIVVRRYITLAVGHSDHWKCYAEDVCPRHRQQAESAQDAWDETYPGCFNEGPVSRRRSLLYDWIRIEIGLRREAR